MRLTPACSFSLILGLVFTSCASTPAPPLPELSMLSVTPVDYDYKFGTPHPGFDLEFDALAENEIAPDRPMVRVDVQVYSVDRESSDGMDPARPLGSAFVTTRDDAERFASEAKSSNRADLVVTQQLSFYEDQRMYAAVMNQTAFVSSFEVEQGEHSVIADPIVDVLQEGAVLRFVSPAVSAETVLLEASLLTCQAEKPFPTVQWIPVAGTSPVEIQRPVVASQELTFDAELSPDQVLVVKCENPNDKNTRLLFFLEARKLEN